MDHCNFDVSSNGPSGIALTEPQSRIARGGKNRVFCVAEERHRRVASLRLRNMFNL